MISQQGVEQPRNPFVPYNTAQDGTRDSSRYIVDHRYGINHSPSQTRFHQDSSQLTDGGFTGVRSSPDVPLQIPRQSIPSHP